MELNCLWLKVWAFETGNRGFESCFCHLQEMRPWAGYLATLDLSFLICKMGVVTCALQSSTEDAKSACSADHWQDHYERLDFFLILFRLFHIFLKEHALPRPSEEEES